MVKSLAAFPEGPEFGSQHPHLTAHHRPPLTHTHNKSLKKLGSMEYVHYLHCDGGFMAYALVRNHVVMCICVTQCMLVSYPNKAINIIPSYNNQFLVTQKHHSFL